jgi:Predicted membrane protein
MSISEEEKLKKLKKMRIIATGLLIFMAVVYISLKSFTDNFLISCIVAFAEASMVGALADWFAVVALFRHPFGLKWIPHTAIIQQNQDRIADSLANFVVDNFFTEEVLRGKLAKIDITESVFKFVRENRVNISAKAADKTPGIIQYVTKEGKVNNAVINGVSGLLRKTELSPYIEGLLTYLISSKKHVPLIKQGVASLYNYVSNNKEGTMNILEDINKALALPIIGDITYKTIQKTLFSLQTDLEYGIETPLVKELTTNLPDKLIENFHDALVLHARIELRKDEFLESDTFVSFINDKLDSTIMQIFDYTNNSKDEITVKLAGFIEKIMAEAEENPAFKDRAEKWIEDTVIQIADNYRDELGKLISDTVNDWPMEDMTQKLEIQVGGDLQYIRINGTVIGGLAGLVIHLLSYLR